MNDDRRVMGPGIPPGAAAVASGRARHARALPRALVSVAVACKGIRVDTIALYPSAEQIQTLLTGPRGRADRHAEPAALQADRRRAGRRRLRRGGLSALRPPDDRVSSRRRARASSGRAAWRRRSSAPAARGSTWSRSWSIRPAPPSCRSRTIRTFRRSACIAPPGSKGSGSSRPRPKSLIVTLERGGVHPHDLPVVAVEVVEGPART